jgi:hypothetical protein
MNIELNEAEWEALEAIIHTTLEEAEEELESSEGTASNPHAIQWFTDVSGIQLAIDIANEGGTDV